MRASGPVQPPDLDLGTRPRPVVGLGDDREGIGLRQRREDVAPLPARATCKVRCHAAALIATWTAPVIAIDEDPDEAAPSTRLGHVVGQHGSIGRSIQGVVMEAAQAP